VRGVGADDERTGGNERRRCRVGNLGGQMDGRTGGQEEDGDESVA